MKTSIILMALILSGCSLLPPGTRHSKTVELLEYGIPQVIVAYGTSLTASGSWVNQLRMILAEKYPGCVTLVNSGAGGKDSRWGLENIGNRVLSFHPNCVFIEFGINDVFPNDHVSLIESRANLDQMIDSILLENPSAEIFLMTMNPRVGDTSIENAAASYYDIYHDIARKRNCMLVDNYSRWMWLLENDPVRFGSYLPDGVHPTEEACRNIVTPNIVEVLGIDESQLEEPALFSQ